MRLRKTLPQIIGTSLANTSRPMHSSLSLVDGAKCFRHRLGGASQLDRYRVPQLPHLLTARCGQLPVVRERRRSGDLTNGQIPEAAVIEPHNAFPTGNTVHARLPVFVGQSRALGVPAILLGTRPTVSNDSAIPGLRADRGRWQIASRRVLQEARCSSTEARQGAAVSGPFTACGSQYSPTPEIGAAPTRSAWAAGIARPYSRCPSGRTNHPPATSAFTPPRIIPPLTAPTHTPPRPQTPMTRGVEYHKPHASHG